MRTKTLQLTALFFLALNCAFAQEKTQESRYKKEPLWIVMMEDTTVNFYETVKAFREYFEERAMPKEPMETEGGDSFEREVGLEERDGGEKSEKERERENRIQNPNEPSYASEVKSFRGWYYSTQPWVRENGTIVGPLERQAIIDKQTEELKEIERTNGKK
jgi:hypothetical protein